MEPSVKQRVNRGASLLDRRRPGWRAKINVARLSLGDPWECVLGQLYGFYTDGLDAVFGKSDGIDAWGHGFALGGEPDDEEKLREAWTRKIGEANG